MQIKYATPTTINKRIERSEVEKINQPFHPILKTKE